MIVISEIYAKINDWYKKNVSRDKILNSGATKEEIHNLEVFLGVELPQDVRDFYCIYNGQKDYSIGFIDGFDLLRLDSIDKIG